MAKSRYTFEKREREKAKRNKQMEKIAQRQMAKKAKADSSREIPQDDTDAAELTATFHPLAEEINNRDCQ